MKIAYIVPSLANAGPVNVVHDLCEVFTQHGHECTVFYFDDKVEQSFPCPVRRIEGQIDFTAFDVVHSHGLRPDAYVSRFREDSVRYVTTLHNYAFQDLTSTYNPVVGLLAGIWWLWNVRRLDVVVALSRHAMEYYHRWLPARKLAWAYNTRMVGGELSAEELAELEEFRNGSFLIGMNAALVRRKRIDRMVRALAELPECKFFVAGDGVERSHLESLAVRLGVADRCFFAGRRAQAWRYLAHYDAMALTSDSEGFPLALLEAAAAGCASVSSDLPIIEECFTPDEVALFSPRSKGSLADAVRRVMADRAGFGARLRARYERDYAPEHFYEKYFEIYKGVTIDE